MSIVGLDSLVFGVDDVDAATKFLVDYGIIEAERATSGATLEGLDGTSIVVRSAADASLPMPNAPTPNLRETIYGVADEAALEKIGAELSKDRAVKPTSSGLLRTVDDAGFALAFRVTVRRPFAAPPGLTNRPGSKPQRPPNVLGTRDDMRFTARSLSHVVYFVPDVPKAEKFYTERLGFRVSDVFTGPGGMRAGVFLRPAGTLEHHSLFLLQSFHPQMVGLNHFTYHFGSVDEVLHAGWRFQQRGYRSFWGPGRHIFGSNYFWYFNSPFGGAIEFDADMDLHDDSWAPRTLPLSKDSSQVFLFEGRDKWSPGG
jgi:catechol 2,3-dioxygenase-like lactoylglutathione lyase family enzyme